MRDRHVDALDLPRAAFAAQLPHRLHQQQQAVHAGRTAIRGDFPPGSSCTGPAKAAELAGAEEELAALDGLVADGVGAVSSPSEAVPVGGA